MNNNPLHTTAKADNLGPVFLGIDWAVFSLSTIVVVLRLFTRIWITRNFGLDDATMALAQMITAVGKGFVVAEVSYGLGQHRASLTIEQYRNFLKYNYLDTSQFFLALAVCKISICLFLLRLSQFQPLTRFLHALIAFLLLTHLILFLLNVLQCNPVHKVWDRGAEGSCFSPRVVMNILIAQGVLSFLTDFICAAFPIVLLRNLKIRTRSKIALCALMGLGIVTGAIAIARVATSWQVMADDLSWVGVPNAMTKVFEVNIGNIAACVPMAKPFSRYVRACVTGRDPHEILLRRRASPGGAGGGATAATGEDTSSSSSPSNWYSLRPWLRRPSPVRTKLEKEMGRMMPGETERTLDLPLQGVRDSFFNISVPHLPPEQGGGGKGGGLEASALHGHGSEGSLMKGGGDTRDVNDII